MGYTPSRGSEFMYKGDIAALLTHPIQERSVYWMKKGVGGVNSHAGG